MFRGLFLVLAVFFAACGGDESSNKTVIRYLAGPDVGGFSKEIIRKFEAANPSYKVEMVEGPSATNTREDMYATSFMAQEDSYDLVYMDVAWLPKFAWVKRTTCRPRRPAPRRG